MAPAAIREPLKSAELKDFNLLPLQQVYEYDLSLDAGETVELKAE
jgi:alpha-L-fucosidase 2